jgi:glycosyltransferase involved in cell wall biosynthesis
MVACWVGRHAPQKKPQDLPLLAQQLDRLGISLVTLGYGLAASREAKGIVAAGGIVLADGIDPHLLYAAADVLVSTSAWEGHPITILEAMRAGLPVVAYAVGGIPEQVDESVTGYLVPPGSLHELAARVALLAKSDSLRRRMGADARARQSRQFGLDTMVDRIEDLYSQVLSSVLGSRQSWSRAV